MKKDAYYFPHFSNARNDSKLIKLRRVMGIEGYGMYFLLLEVLREQTEFRLPLIYLEDLAYEWHTSKEKLIAVVTNFELFDIIDDTFTSTKLIAYLQPYIEKSERARVAARIRWDNANASANALPEHSKSNASKGEESKVKKSKVKDTKEKRVVIFPFDSKNFIDNWKLWKEYRKENGKKQYKPIGEQGALTELSNLANGNEDLAIKIILQTIKKGWAGFYELKKNKSNETGNAVANLIDRYSKEGK